MDLGVPLVDGRPAAFRTTGGTLVFQATRFQHGGPFDPKVGQTLISVGPASDPPAYDAARQDVTNATLRLPVKEDTDATAELPAGNYWVVSSNSAWMTVEACAPAVVSDSGAG